MAGLDPVTTLFSNPLLINWCSVRRRTVQMENGRSKTSEETVDGVVASITPIDNNKQRRTPDSSNSATTHLVITNFRLRKQTKDMLPDIVLYQGNELLVIDVEDYTNFGPGWVQAKCTTKKIQPAATGTQAPPPASFVPQPPPVAPQPEPDDNSGLEQVAGADTSWTLLKAPDPAASLRLYARVPGFGNVELFEGASLDFTLSGNQIATVVSYDAGSLFARYRF